MISLITKATTGILLPRTQPVYRSCVARVLSSESGEAITGNYFERKKAQKELRVQKFHNRLQRTIDLKKRRSQAPVGILKEEFQSWWQAKLAREQKWDRQARQQGKDWKIEVAVVLERLPQILPDKEGFERDFEELKAYLAQFGKQYPKEFSSSIQGNGAAPISDEELIALLPDGYRPSPRETESDKSGKKDTVDRKLKDSVYLLIHGKLPTTFLTENESLLEAAQRAVKESGGQRLELYCPSGAPVAVHLTKNQDGSEPYFGVKTFFLRLQYDDGPVQANDMSKNEIAWLDRSEILQLHEQNDDEQAKLYKYLL